MQSEYEKERHLVLNVEGKETTKLLNISVEATSNK